MPRALRSPLIFLILISFVVVFCSGVVTHCPSALLLFVFIYLCAYYAVLWHCLISFRSHAEYTILLRGNVHMLFGLLKKKEKKITKQKREREGVRV